MRILRVSLAICVLIAVCHAAPATLDSAQSSAIEPANDREVIEIINLENFGQSDRDKRDINMLRQLFPGLAQIVDNIIQEVTRQLFRVVGRAVLSGGALGGGGGGDGASEGGRGKVSVSLPTFPPDDDEDEDEEEEDSSNNNSTSSTTINTPLKAAADEDDNTLSGSESQNSEVRVKFDEQSNDNAPSPAEESSDDADDADRNKRFLPFGGSGGDGHAAAGGSGNFLFDIIRLVAGSGQSEHADAAANAPEVDVAKGADGYTEGIPGPITRLFVIANRGIANLIQDLILRLAQTSERIVNFKARLVTALI